MNDHELSTHDFKVDEGAGRIPEFLPSCRQAAMSEDGRTLEVYLTGDRELDYREIGRILILSGKYRNRKIQFVLHCSGVVANQLKSFHIDRIVQVE